MAHCPAISRACLGLPWLVSAVALGCFYGAMMASGNFHEVVPQRVYRSGQPTPEQLRTWIRQYGLKTIVNLRGPDAPLVAEEREIAQSMGAGAVCLRLCKRELMPRQELMRLIEVLQTAEGPILLHCFYGVDRAGTASALAAWLVGAKPYDQAKWQAYVPPGPWKRRNGSDHVSDVLALYERYCFEHGRSPDDPLLFKRWVAEIYSPPEYRVERRVPRRDGAKTRG